MVLLPVTTLVATTLAPTVAALVAAALLAGLGAGLGALEVEARHVAVAASRTPAISSAVSRVGAPLRFGVAAGGSRLHSGGLMKRLSLGDREGRHQTAPHQ
jgi:hypothetical protein